MARIEVNDAIFDADLMDRFDVIRRGGGDVNQFGEVLTTPLRFHARGMVTAAGPNDLLMQPDFQIMGKRLTVVTNFRLQGPAPRAQPDIIVWPLANTGSDYFKVDRIDDYSQYGRGFIQAECTSIDPIDLAAMPEDQR